MTAGGCHGASCIREPAAYRMQPFEHSKMTALCCLHYSVGTVMSAEAYALRMRPLKDAEVAARGGLLREALSRVALGMCPLDYFNVARTCCCRAVVIDGLACRTAYVTAIAQRTLHYREVAAPGR